MRAMQIFLGVSAAVWLSYGLFCFAQPGFLSEAAGVTANTATAGAELRAMYGGLQAAIGCLMLAAIFRPGLRGTALVTLLFLCSGLALGRLGGALLEAGFSPYTTIGLGFEITSAGLALFFLRRTPGLVPA
ncbi:MAG: DUF4345 domain-containing protein [Myxococcota bacterium]